MGLLSSLLTFPVSGPVAGIRWSLRQVQRVVDEELTDDTPIKEELMQLQMRLEMGDIDDAEYVERERDLMDRLRAVREWRERLGRGSTAGPVRVAAPEAEVSVADGVAPPPAEHTTDRSGRGPSGAE